MDQLNLFGPARSRAPEGFKYQPSVISTGDESAILQHIRDLPFAEFDFHGYKGKRRVVSFGWQYDFTQRALNKVEDMPAFLLSLREAAATFAGLAADNLQHALVTEYSPGAPIGWHKDKAVFGDVVGISLLASCTFRLRRMTDNGWDRFSLIAEPRSAYLLRGPSRTEWEHSIPPVQHLRYSVTFRNLREAM
jgi:alkylated DNA repair dioxygenase AlkB